MPKVLASRVTMCASSALRSKALVGMQPTFRQTPPQYLASTTATRLPSWAARMAATYPPGPAPSTTTSKRSPCSSMEISFLTRIGSGHRREPTHPGRTACAPARRPWFPTPVRGRKITRKTMRAIGRPVTSSLVFGPSSMLPQPGRLGTPVAQTLRLSPTPSCHRTAARQRPAGRGTARARESTRPGRRAQAAGSPSGRPGCRRIAHESKPDHVIIWATTVRRQGAGTVADGAAGTRTLRCRGACPLAGSGVLRDCVEGRH